MDPFLPAFSSREEFAVIPQFFLHEGEECVRVVIGGNSRFAPVFRAEDFWQRGEFGQELYYKDRWPEQYRQFKDGSAQTAGGTALEEAPFLNESRIRDLRALKVFSVEGLASFDDRYITRLGGHGYRLKELAQEFINNRAQNGGVNRLSEENEVLKARLAALEARMGTLPVADDDNVKALKEEIKGLTGSYPRGNPSAETLKAILADLKSEQAA